MDSRFRGNDGGRWRGSDGGRRGTLARFGHGRRPTRPPRRAGALARSAALALTLAGAATAPALAQEVSVSITSTPANDTHYVAGEAITTRLTMPQIQSGAVQNARMKLDVGGVERQAASTSSYAYRLTQVNFTYTVVAADVDADGISLPANSIIGGQWQRVGGGFLNFSHSALSNQSAHRVFGTPAYLSATNPASLTEATLNGATVTVSLGGPTFASGVSAFSFALVTSPAIAGLPISNVTGGASGSTSATLTLATGTGFDFDTPATLAVRVRAAAHSGSSDVTTGRTVPLTPTDEAPSFGSGSVPAKTFFRNRAIAEFQVPAATGGNGALAYTVSGLPAGLVFDADGPGRLPRRDAKKTPPRQAMG